MLTIRGYSWNDRFGVGPPGTGILHSLSYQGRAMGWCQMGQALRRFQKYIPTLTTFAFTERLG
jgi:hypothetical protein